MRWKLGRGPGLGELGGGPRTNLASVGWKKGAVCGITSPRLLPQGQQATGIEQRDKDTLLKFRVRPKNLKAIRGPLVLSTWFTAAHVVDKDTESPRGEMTSSGTAGHTCARAPRRTHASCLGTPQPALNMVCVGRSLGEDSPEARCGAVSGRPQARWKVLVLENALLVHAVSSHPFQECPRNAPASLTRMMGAF